METVSDSEKIVFDWIPLERVGPFVFGDLIEKYCDKFKLKQIPEEYNEKVGWQVWRKDSRFSVFSERERIVAVSCSTSCNYRNIDLIGISVKDVISILDTIPDSVEMIHLVEGPQKVYDFDDLELQLWAKNDVVETAICSGPFGEETGPHLKK
ncbi:hypothetical protein DENIS_3871 [Desulfonema ishimotonii]|uniref:Uncharacterized protein n=1 Tax=Desulfonema ishimotonii TaxID=45657 RepID=A0A401G104_9BACT|nr:hypothetical protein [Desulfonema ishimotonii]GBC62887.1 hypothetical protein DENIS_3871 [Desulfonema ishimotonii]